ncbi:alpha/beta hydrolase [Paenibacillus filicis]|uniref:Alpha/beta hydrolase n=1 Tax=Paenibacillus filicis TaxID=669464 RepID=A0ABU9DDQ2_9BACL
MKTHQGTIHIDGFELGYRIEGEGLPVLIVGSSVYYPRLFSKALRSKLQLIFIDHRGFVPAPRELEPEDYLLGQIVSDIETMRERLGIEDFVILGHSGHAFLAAEYARQYPGQVRKVVLMNSAPSNRQERQQQSFAYFDETASLGRKKKFEEDIAGLAAELEREPERRFAHLLVRMGAHSFYDYEFDASRMWDGVYTNMPVIDHLWGEAFAQLDLLDMLADIHQPVLLGLGAYDYLVAPTSLWDTVEERHPHVTKVIFRQSGHNPMFEEPELTDSILLDWVVPAE